VSTIISRDLTPEERNELAGPIEIELERLRHLHTLESDDLVERYKDALDVINGESAQREMTSDLLEQLRLISNALREEQRRECLPRAVESDQDELQGE
jgi:hypothetical protein